MENIITELSKQKCVPCESDLPPLTESEIETLLTDVPELDVVKAEGIPQLKRSFEFKNFVESLKFTNTIGEIAEEQGHHPLIELAWGRVTIFWWTHNINGLHKTTLSWQPKSAKLINKTLIDG